MFRKLCVIGMAALLAAPMLSMRAHAEKPPAPATKSVREGFVTPLHLTVFAIPYAGSLGDGGIISAEDYGAALDAIGLKQITLDKQNLDEQSPLVLTAAADSKALDKLASAASTAWVLTLYANPVAFNAPKAEAYSTALQQNFSGSLSLTKTNALHVETQVSTEAGHQTEGGSLMRESVEKDFNVIVPTGGQNAVVFPGVYRISGRDSLLILVTTVDPHAN